MFARLLLFLFATHAACWSAGPSLIPQEQFKPTTTATELLNSGVQPRGLHIAHQVILVHPSDDLVSVLSYAAAGDVLLLANGVYKPEATDASALVISKNITIAAQQTGQAVLDGQEFRRVLEITNGHVLLKGLNITNGYAGYAGGIYISDGTVNINNSEISSNLAYTGTGGGGIVINGGTVNIDNSQISSNTATHGGGIYVYMGTVNIDNSQISSNTANYYGGGIYIDDGTVNIHNSQLSSNSAYGVGGGAYLSKGTTNFSNCSIAGNQADDKGGGIYAEQGARVQLDDRSAVQSNKPDGCYGFWSSPACNKQ